jgi:hypothetical protein
MGAEGDEGGAEMRAVVVYESMYGNTRLIAEAIVEGLAPDVDVFATAVEHADAAVLNAADLVVVGGPTHVHSMSRPSSRKAAIEAAHKPDAELHLEPDVEGDGLREWFARLGQLTTNAAAFDTRLEGPALITGRASKAIARKLRQHGAHLVAEPCSFLVTKHNELAPDEVARARAWGSTLGRALASANFHHSPGKLTGAEKS